MSFVDLQITNLLWCNWFHHWSLHSHCHHHRPNGLGYICHWNNWTGYQSRNVHSQPHHSHLHSRHLERSINNQVVKNYPWRNIFFMKYLAFIFGIECFLLLLKKGMINQSSTFPMSSGKIISIFILLCFWLNANH